MKRIPIMLIASLLMFLFSSAAGASQEISVVINGKQQSYEQAPINQNGNVLVPMRGLFEAVGAKVEWNGEDRTVTASAHDTSVYLQIDNKTVRVNGSERLLEVAPVIHNGFTMVPLRFVGEALDFYVVWDGRNQRVILSSDTPLYGRTKQEVKEKYEAYMPSFTDKPYLEMPLGGPDYAPGKLQQGFLEDGLHMANMARYLAELPDDLVLDDELNRKAQYGAVLLYGNRSLSHTPPKPADMDEDFYKLGYSSTSSSNIAQGYTKLSSSVLGYLDDGDRNNIDRIGHRRWILNPSLKKLGFGYYERFSTMQVFDRSRETKVDYDYIAYPKGVFPTEMFSKSHPWHVSLNPSKYQEPRADAVQVRLERMSDNKEWVIDQQSAKKGSDYFNIDLGGYGVSNAIIFRVDQLTPLEGMYKVTITGLKDRNGQDAAIQYVTDLFTMGVTPPR
jgi:uncharacterized protein YkwD